MIVTTHQPIFFPWPGLFFKALRADTLVLLDQVQFPLGRGWMNRNRFKSDKGELWLTVPVWKKGRALQLISEAASRPSLACGPRLVPISEAASRPSLACGPRLVPISEVEICDEGGWRRKHLLSLRQQYRHAPYGDEHLPAIEAIYESGHRRLLDLNLDIIRYHATALGITTAFVLQSELGVSGRGTTLLVDICRALKADTYVTLRPVEKYLDLAQFAASGIRLEFARFAPPRYPQLWGEFRYNLAALDLLLNCGPKAHAILARG